MALKISFKLRKKLAPDSDEMVTIYYRVTESKRLDVTKKTPFSIEYKNWDHEMERIKDKAVARDQINLDRLITIDRQLNALRSYLQTEIYKLADVNEETVVNLVSNFFKNKDKIIDDETVVHKKIPTIPEYLDDLIARMKSGLKRVGGEKYTQGTIKAWTSFSKLMKKFCDAFKEKNDRDFEWADFNKDGFMLFLSFMEDEDYIVTTINKYVVDINAMVTSAQEEDILGDLVIKKKCPRKRALKEEIPVKVYLTNEELDALYKMPLEEGSMKCKVRDIFLCGAYTAQRISDYKNLSPENFIKIPDRDHPGKEFNIVILRQEKTKTEVWIPVLNENLLEIGKKYNFRFPRVVDQVLNRYIKDILKDLSQSVPSLAEKIPTVLNMKQKKAENEGKTTFEKDEIKRPVFPRYELVSSHTARRSCITNLYLEERFTNEQLMSISGHKDEKTFKQYIVCSGLVIAKKILEINNRKSNEDLFH